jgi:glycerol-3-phosphate dehydrogenase
LDALRDGSFDVLVLGGGITGAGIALDATTRGLRVALIDKGDFASGTSSVSSKLVHGGLRYLEHRQFRLVYEALHERGLLLQNAPHLVRPLQFIIPFFQESRVPPWKWRAGMLLYDIMAGSRNIHRSYPFNRRQLLGALPGLVAKALRGGAAYFDAQMDDARLCIEVVKTAASYGACVANYVEAVAFEKTAGQISGVTVADRVGSGEWTIRARQVVNATGPWVDSVCRLAGDDAGPLLRPTKGVHIITAGIGLSSALLLLHPRDGRVFFIIPWPRPGLRHTKTLIGTTDTLCDDSPDALTVTDEDIDYLLEGYSHYLTPPPSQNAVLASFVGLRPLIRARAGEPSSLSREFRLFWSPSGMLSVAGGKYTTYRHMAEIATDAVAKRLGCKKPCCTRRLLLDGTPAASWNLFQQENVAAIGDRFSLAKEAAHHLVDRYGRRAVDVADYAKRSPQAMRPVTAGEPELAMELAYQRDYEMAIKPADFLLRRTRLGLVRPELLQSQSIDALVAYAKTG